MSRPILITGANGNVSSGIISILRGAGVPVRALVRDPEKSAALHMPGVDLAVADLERPRSLPPAFAGIDTAWILTPPGPRAPEQSSNALWAARQAGVRRIVRMSAIGAAHDAPTINGRLHALADAELVASGLDYTILKPHFFMQNLLMAAQSVANQGAMYLALADARMPMIDVRDISEAAAMVLTTSGHEKRTYTLTGPNAWTMADAATAIAAATGKSVKYVPVPIEAADDAMAELGMDEWMRNLMTDYFAAYSRRWASEVTTDFASIAGHPARGIMEFARDFSAAFTAAHR